MSFTEIVIVGFRNSCDIRECILALAKSSEKNFSITICENGGADAYKSLISELSGLVFPTEDFEAILDDQVESVWQGAICQNKQRVRIFLANGNLGYAGGVNVCLRQLAHLDNWSAVWILNPDTEPAPNALGELIKRADHGKYDIISSRLVYKETRLIQSYGGRWRPWIARGLNIGLWEPENATPNFEEIERNMNYVSGAALFVTRSFIEDIGLMDERYFLYCEEVDWCLRRGKRRLGYAHNSIVYHIGSSTIGDRSATNRSKLSVYLAERNRLLLTRRFYPRLYPFVILTSLLLTAKHLQLGSLKNFLIALSGWWKGVCGENGPPNQLLSQ